MRNLLDAEDGFLTRKTKLIMDRDPVFTSDVRALLRSGGFDTVRLPARSPNLNAFAERFVLSIKSECLDRLILLGEGHLRMAVREYVAHYNLERPHQGLDGRLLTPANENEVGQIECRERTLLPSGGCITAPIVFPYMTRTWYARFAYRRGYY